jgi:tripartite-type tricarboxylate transporter receptor subunit TctC
MFRRIMSMAVAVAAAVPSPAWPDAVADFYRGNTIRIINWAPSGGEYDIHGRLVSRHLGRHIPGNPQIVHVNMTGGGGLVAANHIYNIAPRDGTTLGIMVSSTPLSQALGETGVKYDAARFNWIGTISPTQENLVAWHTSGVKTFEDLRSREFVLGASGAGSTSVISPKVMNALLGTRIKIVPGYPGGSQINLAMERGESMGRWNTWSSWKVTNPEWIQSRKIVVLVQSSMKKHPDLPDVPLLIDLAASDDDKTIFRLLATSAELGRPLTTTPGVPADRLAALKAAYATMLKDPEFLREAQQLKIEVAPLLADDLQMLVSRAISTPLRIIDRLTAILN